MTVGATRLTSCRTLGKRGLLRLHVRVVLGATQKSPVRSSRQVMAVSGSEGAFRTLRVLLRLG
jgi:hypothetical protein